MLAMKGLGDIVLLDTPSKENPTKGKALDIMEASPLIHSSVQITGTSNYKSTADSDVVIITAGIARKPGMSRDELCDINAEIITNVVHQVVRYSPDCTLIILSNPVDIMTYIALKASRFTRNRVIGQSGVLDTARFRYFVADELKVSSEDVTGFVLGVHGDDMVPLVRYCSVHGIPIQQLLSEEKLKNHRTNSSCRCGNCEFVRRWKCILCACCCFNSNSRVDFVGSASCNALCGTLRRRTRV